MRHSLLGATFADAIVVPFITTIVVSPNIGHDLIQHRILPAKMMMMSSKTTLMDDMCSCYEGVDTVVATKDLLTSGSSGPSGCDFVVQDF